MSFTYNIPDFYAGKIPLNPPPPAFFKACRSEIYIAKQEEVWRKKKRGKKAPLLESVLCDAPCVQLFNCFIRSMTGTRNNALMLNTQVNIAKKDLNIA